jgi:ADP-heptose:LPS heptosyltransferase
MKYLGMGSILLASPMLRAIRKTYPTVKIGFLTFACNVEMVHRLGLVDNVYTLRTDNLIQFVADLAKCLRKIRRERFQATIDMEFFSKFSTIVTYLSGSPIRIGYFLRQLWRGDLLTHQVYYNHYKHITEVFGALAAPLGVEVKDFTVQQPTIYPTDEEAVEGLLRAAEIRSEELLIGVNVNAGDLSTERRWPKEEFQDLLNRVVAELKARLVFIGNASEAAYVREVLSGISHNGCMVNLAGRTSLGELLAILRRCALFITNDGGPLHLAASCGIPTVSFFGPETPQLYGPCGNNALVFHANLYCSPCLNVFNVKTAPCAGINSCMRNIRADAVLASIRKTHRHLWEKYGYGSRA